MAASPAQLARLAAGLLGAVFTPHCAALDPARLARGLAQVVERLGVPIYESTPVTRLRADRVDTTRGPVRADFTVRATEGWTATLPGSRRAVMPLNSLLLATEPLPAEVWDRIGWNGGETLATGTHLSMYAQRTRDGRIACGRRGAPYHFGSRIRTGHDRDDRVHDRLRAVLRKLLPQTGDVGVSHRWGGPIGISRDWTPQSASTAPAVWRGPAAMSATASPCPTWPAAPWPT